jgi:hypothetical protein
MMKIHEPVDPQKYRDDSLDQLMIDVRDKIVKGLDVTPRNQQAREDN